ncbi:MAG: FxsA family protein [Gemmatimonadetes bacterium]|uniref:FxsA family protein n=1 Tax=Candidatus Kutchimonas denitrificans TaxID=3056748 RepID=A0AAE4Z8E0_9BACT|nr:FxsA family protein [Gemmatimonadota bacterium]NIR74878.1 FxsA family protein [Candidatus Kutchimonas denitrificans]NIR99989.1 FxsA family protein [Gemmatimonadota bacterium]NIT65573.1 FxsA family protein [Gemmatimonadota bacterium]NIU52543.1 FxsA family protein [Gemmatimonadota bacterium]
MFRRLLPLFIIVPIVELALLIQLGRWVGLWPTLALIAITGIAGAALASREGLRAWREFQLEMWQGRVPGRQIMDGISILAGGALLLTPGLLTDVVGFGLVVRPTRRWLQNRVVNRFAGRLVRGGQFYVHMPPDRGGPETGEGPGAAGRGRGREVGRDGG